LEEQYDAKISAEKLKSSKTVQDVVDYLYELLVEQNVPETAEETS
jgi:acyl carrier protein